MIVSELSERMANNLTSELGLDEEKKEIVAYGIESAILSVMGLASVMIVSLIVDAFLPAVIAVFFGGFLRKLSGGAHFDTPFKCLAFGTVIYSVLGVVANAVIAYDLYSEKMSLGLLIICLMIAARLAPVDSESKPIHSEVFKRKLKTASIAFIILAVLFVLFSHHDLLNTSAVLGIGYQTITLLPVFNKKKRRSSS